MSKVTIIRLYLALALAFSAFQCGNDRPKAPPAEPPRSAAPAPAEVPAFDGEKAMAFLTAQTDFGPRAPGSRAHEECLAYLKDEMNKYADAVVLQPFTHAGYDGKILNLTNVFSSFNLRAQTRILLIAHWDSRPRADRDPDSSKRNLPIPGANDGASGIAILLEMARHFKEQPPTVGVDMLFDDGEDYGKEGDDKDYFLGADYFCHNMPPGFRPVFGILLDMVGDAQLDIQQEPYSLEYAPDVVNLVWSTAQNLNIYQFSNQTQPGVRDDHLPLNRAGIKTIDLIDFNYPDDTNRYWHTTQDTPDKCSAESLKAVGTVLLAVIYHYPS